MEIASDLRLTADARVCALHLLGLGPGEHEVHHRRWRSILNDASRERVRDALGLLEEFGLVERTNGGSRPDRYELCAGILPHNNISGENLPHNENLSGENPPHRRINGEENPHTKPRARDAVPDDDAPAVPAVGAREKFPIDPKAEKALDGRFAGCRDSIRDALRYRVDPEFHYAFVMSLLAYIQQSRRLVDGQGKTVPADQVPALIASTLNELGPEIDQANNPTRKVTANLHGLARRVNEPPRNGRKPPKPAEDGIPMGWTKEEFDALAS